MANLTIELPDDLARSLAASAAAQRRTVEELIVERLLFPPVSSFGGEAGSPSAVLRAMHEPPHLNSGEVDELEEAIAASRLPVKTRELF